MLASLSAFSRCRSTIRSCRQTNGTEYFRSAVENLVVNEMITDVRSRRISIRTHRNNTHGSCVFLFHCYSTHASGSDVHWVAHRGSFDYQSLLYRDYSPRARPTNGHVAWSCVRHAWVCGAAGACGARFADAVCDDTTSGALDRWPRPHQLVPSAAEYRRGPLQYYISRSSRCCPEGFASNCFDILGAALCSAGNCVFGLASKHFRHGLPPCHCVNAVDGSEFLHREHQFDRKHISAFMIERGHEPFFDGGNQLFRRNPGTLFQPGGF